MLESLSNAVKCLQAIRLATLLKRVLRTGVSERAVRRSSTKKVFLNNSQISQESTCVAVSFNKAAGPQNSKFIKKRLQHRFFYCEFEELFKHIYFAEDL